MHFDFAMPELISTEISRKDEVKVEFNDTKAFIAKNGQYMRPKFELRFTMPRQRAKDVVAIDTKSLRATSQNVARGTLIAKFFLDLLAYQLLSYISNLAMIIHMFILQLNYPVHVQEFFASLFPLITFDVIPTEKLYEFTLDFDEVEEESLTDQFEIVGYGDILMIRNMGSMFLMLVMMPILTVLSWIALKLIPNQDWCVVG